VENDSICETDEDFFRGMSYIIFSQYYWYYFCTDCNKRYKYQVEKCECGNAYFIIGRYP